MTTTPTDARNALAEIVAGLDGVTPGPWRRQTLGGSSTVLSEVKPPNNDRRAASYGYRDQEYCLAHAFLDDDDRARMDFVCFGHSDAAHIARCYPATLRSIAALVSSQDARIAALEAQVEGMRVADVADAINPERSPDGGWRDQLLNVIHADIENRGRVNADFAVTVHHRNIVISAVARALSAMPASFETTNGRQIIETAIYRMCVIEDSPNLNSGEKALIRGWITEARAALQSSETTGEK